MLENRGILSSTPSEEPIPAVCDGREITTGWRRHAERRQNRHVRSLRAGVAIRHRRTTAQFGTP